MLSAWPVLASAAALTASCSPPLTQTFYGVVPADAAWLPDRDGGACASASGESSDAGAVDCGTDEASTPGDAGERD
jgi:hypothetical protein